MVTLLNYYNVVAERVQHCPERVHVIALRVHHLPYVGLVALAVNGHSVDG